MRQCIIFRYQCTYHLQDDTPSLKRQPSFKWAQYVNPTKSPTKLDVESPQPSPQQTEPDTSHSRALQQSQPQSHRQPPASVESPVQPSPSTSSRPSRQDSTDNLKTFKVSIDDPTWKVLPAALKKYKINNDHWQNYAMFICYGSPGQYNEIYDLESVSFSPQETALSDVSATMKNLFYSSRNSKRRRRILFSCSNTLRISVLPSPSHNKSTHCARHPSPPSRHPANPTSLQRRGRARRLCGHRNWKFTTSQLPHSR